MTRKTIILFFAVLFVFHAGGQRIVPDPRWTAGLSFGILPLPGSGLGIQPSLEYYFTERWSLLTDITLQTEKKNNADSMALDKKYFRVRPELRYIVSPPEKIAKFYVGLQGGFASRSFTTMKNGYYFDKPESDSAWIFDKGRVNSPINTFSFQMGLLISNKSRLSMDMYFGAGARFINTSFSGLENLRYDIRRLGLFSFGIKRAYNQIGKITHSHYVAGIRLIWRFSRQEPRKHE